MAARRLRVSLVFDPKEWSKGISTVKRSLTRFARGMRDVGITAGKNLIRGFVSTVRTMTRWAVRGVVGALAAGIAGVVWTTHLASQAEEVRSKFGAVFKDLTGQAEEFVQGIRSKYGLAATDIRSVMSEFQDTLVPLGMMRADAMKMSEGLTTLALDLASFSPRIKDAGEAGDMLRAILTGSHEVAKNFGVAINDASLKQELMNLGLAESVQKATDAEKALARYSMMVKGTKDAQGDLLRTGNSFKNTWNRIKATFKETGELVGQIVMPVMRSLLNLLNAIVSKLRDALAGQMPAITATIEKLTGWIDKLTARIEAMKLKEMFGALAGGLKQALLAVADVLLDIGERMGEKIGKGIRNAFAGKGGAAGAIGPTLLGPGGVLLEWLGQKAVERQGSGGRASVEETVGEIFGRRLGGLGLGEDPAGPTGPLGRIAQQLSTSAQRAFAPRGFVVGGEALAEGFARAWKAKGGFRGLFAGDGEGTLEGWIRQMAAKLRAEKPDVELTRFADMAQDLAESTRSPMEVFTAQIEDLKGLWARRGALAEMGVEVTPEMIRRAAQQAAAGLGGGARGEIPTVGAKLAGSREAYSAILQHQLGRGAESMPRNVASMLGVLRNLLQETKDQHATIKDQEVDVIDISTGGGK